MKLAPNRPSKKHVWQLVNYTQSTGAVERCSRCKCHFIEKADATAARYCSPTPEWLWEHPEDNREEF